MTCDVAVPGTVCIIDDDEHVRSSLSSLLRANGYDVTAFANPHDFMASKPHDGASCLLLDIRLSGESGLDFQEVLLTQSRALPVILMTGHGDIPMTVRGMRAGAVDVLPKPFTEEHLLAAVTAALAADAAGRDEARNLAMLRDRLDRLTPREREVFALVVTGLMNKQVAAHMELSEITVKIHRGHVMRKMEAASLPELVRMAETLGIRDESIGRYHI